MRAVLAVSLYEKFGFECEGLSESNVGAKISRIKNQLSEKMKGYEYGNE